MTIFVQIGVGNEFSGSRKVEATERDGNEGSITASEIDDTAALVSAIKAQLRRATLISFRNSQGGKSHGREIV